MRAKLKQIAKSEIPRIIAAPSDRPSIDRLLHRNNLRGMGDESDAPKKRTHEEAHWRGLANHPGARTIEQAAADEKRAAFSGKSVLDEMSEWVLHCAVNQRHIRRSQPTRDAALEDACSQLLQGHAVNRIIGPNEIINAHKIKEWCAKHRSSPIREAADRTCD
jgi:hypothetical protein